MESKVKTGLAFGEFVADINKRLLRKSGATIRLKPKTFDFLLALIENSGRLLTKHELLDKVWENQFVEETT